MAFVHRSPTESTNKPQTSLDHSLSAPDLNEAVFTSENVNSKSRTKRPRYDESPQYQLSEFTQDIKDMLSSWKTDHSNLAKLVSDQTSLITRLISDMADLKLQNAQIQKSSTEIEKSITFINEQYEDMRNQIKKLQEENHRNTMHTEILEKKLQDIQYKTRSSCIEFRNIPNIEKETVNDLTKIITSVGVKVNFPVCSTDLRDVYRTGGKSDANKSIIAEFSTVQKKQGFLSSVRTFNSKQPKDQKLNTSQIGISGNRQPIYVEDHLSSTTKKLFYLARQFAKQHGYSFCWAANGNIFLRKQQGDKQVLVKTENTLKELEDNQ